MRRWLTDRPFKRYQPRPADRTATSTQRAVRPLPLTLIRTQEKTNRVSDLQTPCPTYALTVPCQAGEAFRRVCDGWPRLGESMHRAFGGVINRNCGPRQIKEGKRLRSDTKTPSARPISNRRGCARGSQASEPIH